MVVTVVPLGDTTLSLWELYSEVNTLPHTSTATPVGMFQAKLPPRLLATLAGLTLRNLLVECSAMYTLPRVSTARRALPAVVKVGAAPSRDPAEALPAQVDTFHRGGTSASGQAAQPAAPTLLDRPAGQGLQAGAAACAAAVPAAQGKGGVP
jgi:hypothetical protein